MHLLISGYSGMGGASAENAVLGHRDGGGNDLLGQGAGVLRVCGAEEGLCIGRGHGKSFDQLPMNLIWGAFNFFLCQCSLGIAWKLWGLSS